jgi:uncharacterized ferritin-like protein (DUF455 family)
MVLNQASVFRKLEQIELTIQLALTNDALLESVPDQPARDVLVAIPEFHPAKKGLSYKEGQARLLHDLASIEMQAMELGLRTLIEFPQAPKLFREQLADVVLSEARHLKLCLQGIETLGFQWGFVPVHTLLWASTAKSDSLLDRILIVHRYLEGSGLDAGETLLRRLSGVEESCVHKAAKTIFEEEIGHVLFGSNWYRELCKADQLDPEVDYPSRMQSLRRILPKRIEPISRLQRRRAGFSETEIEYLENLRASMMKYS